MAEPLRVVAVATGKDPYVMILTGGEDHALAATFPRTAAIPEGWTVIGTVGAVTDPATPVLVDGALWEAPGGYDHFRGRR